MLNIAIISYISVVNNHIVTFVVLVKSVTYLQIIVDRNIIITL